MGTMYDMAHRWGVFKWQNVETESGFSITVLGLKATSVSKEKAVELSDKGEFVLEMWRNMGTGVTTEQDF